MFGCLCSHVHWLLLFLCVRRICSSWLYETLPTIWSTDHMWNFANTKALQFVWVERTSIYDQFHASFAGFFALWVLSERLALKPSLFSQLHLLVWIHSDHPDEKISYPLISFSYHLDNQLCKTNEWVRKFAFWCKLMEKLLKICLWIWCWGKYFEKTNLKRHNSMPLLLGNGLNIFQFRTTIQVMILNDDLRNLKLSYLN